MRVKEAAERLEVSADTVYDLVKSGKLRHYRLGVGRGTIRISEEHLAEYLAGAESRPATAPIVRARPVKLRHFRHP
jgi:excisionase family DNA binding protein